MIIDAETLVRLYVFSGSIEKTSNSELNGSALINKSILLLLMKEEGVEILGNVGRRKREVEMGG